MAANVAELGWLFDPFTPPPTNTTHLRKVDYTVRDCSWAAAKQLVAAHHYAGKSADITIYRHGLYRRVGNALVGVAIWMPPTKAAALSIDSDWQGVLCLTRLVVGPNEPTNAASYLLGRSMRIIKQDNRFHTLVTYADEAQGHTGAIYRATNWTYCEPTARSLQGDIAYTDSRGGGCRSVVLAVVRTPTPRCCRWVTAASTHHASISSSSDFGVVPHDAPNRSVAG